MFKVIKLHEIRKDAEISAQLMHEKEESNGNAYMPTEAARAALRDATLFAKTKYKPKKPKNFLVAKFATK